MRTHFQYMETILTVVCDDGMDIHIPDGVFEARSIIEMKIAEDSFFGITYDPYPVSKRDDPLIQRMCRDRNWRGSVLWPVSQGLSHSAPPRS